MYFDVPAALQIIKLEVFLLTIQAAMLGIGNTYIVLFVDSYSF